MEQYKVISADTHIIEPPDLYENRMEPEFRGSIPRMERRRNESGMEYDSWFVGDLQVGTIGTLIQAGKRFEDQEALELIGTWDEARKGGFDPHEMIKDLQRDGVWGGCLQPSQGLLWYRMSDSRLLSAIHSAYNSWIGDFCRPYPGRLKGIACINVDDPEEASEELKRCAKLGLAASFIPVYPLPEAPYRHPKYDRLWATAQDLDMPLILHIGTVRAGIPGCEETIDVTEITQAGVATIDHWVRYSLTSMIFAGVFDRYPQLQVGTVEHEMGWIPHWLKQMDFNYVNRPKIGTGWRSERGLLPTDYWRNNMFAQFMEDDIGILLRDMIGVEQMMWGSDYPHVQSTWPKSMEYLDRILEGVTDEERRQMTSGNAARIFGFDI